MSRHWTSDEGQLYLSSIEGKKAASRAIADGLVLTIDAAVDSQGDASSANI
jgi:hypothetical protein